MISRRTSCLGGAALAAFAIATVRTAGATVPAAPILTVSGSIGVKNEAGAVVFARPDLEALGTEAFETMTPWYDGVVRFEGVPMARLMAAVGAVGDTLRVTALNDYATDVPIADFATYGVLLALKRNGQYMPIRDKGPLFVVYPYDTRPELRSQRFYSRSAWQVARMEVR